MVGPNRHQQVGRAGAGVMARTSQAREAGFRCGVLLALLKAAGGLSEVSNSWQCAESACHGVSLTPLFS